MNQIQAFQNCSVDINTSYVNNNILFGISVDVDRLKPYNREGITRNELVKTILKMEKENPLNEFEYKLNGEYIIDLSSTKPITDPLDSILAEIIHYADHKYLYPYIELSVMSHDPEYKSMMVEFMIINNMNNSQLIRKLHELEFTLSYKAIIYDKDDKYKEFENQYLSDDIKKFTTIFNVIMRCDITDFGEYVGSLEYYLDGKYHVATFANKRKRFLLNTMYDAIYKNIPASITDTHYIHVIHVIPYNETDYKEDAQILIPFMKNKESENPDCDYSVTNAYLQKIPKVIDMKDAA